MNSRRPDWPTWLRQQIELRGYDSPTALARDAGIAPSLVSRWLTRRAEPSDESLRRLAGPLGVPLEQLWLYAGRMGDHLEPSGEDATEPEEAVRNDPRLNKEQKKYLLYQIHLARLESEAKRDTQTKDANGSRKRRSRDAS